MSSIRKNTLANYLGIGWGIVSVYLFIPLYLKFLGIEAYGLVGFYATLLGVLVFADMGLTATLNREMARLSAEEGSAGRMRDLLRTYESLYLLISLAVAGAIWLAAPLIAEQWLKAGALAPQEIASVIRLMGVAIALQLPAGLYTGGLLGLQRQVLSNALQIAWGVWRGVGAVLALWLYSPTITVFAAWQIVSNAAYVLAVRFALWRAVPPAAARPRFDGAALRRTWRYAAGMAGMSLLAAILVQADKLVVSKMLPLEIFGYYSLAGSLAMAPVILANPIGVAVFPRLTGLVAGGDTEALKGLYHKACGLVGVAVLPAALTIALLAAPLLFAWTGSAAAARKAGLVASLLIVGQAAKALTVVPYYLAMAHGRTKLILQVQILSIALLVPLSVFLVSEFGLLGAGIASLAVSLGTFPLYMQQLHRRFLPGELGTWLRRDVGRALLAALPPSLIGGWLVPRTSSRLGTFALIAIVWALSAVVAAASMPELRAEAIGRCRAIAGRKR